MIMIIMKRIQEQNGYYTNAGVVKSQLKAAHKNLTN